VAANDAMADSAFVTSIAEAQIVAMRLRGTRARK
jgi:hypothetical protein